jgi:hypothetical protein
MKRPGSGGEIHRSFFASWCSAGTRTGEGADEQEEKRDFRSASTRSRAAKADVENDEAQAVESPLRHHLNNKRDFGFAPKPLFSSKRAEWLICGSQVDSLRVIYPRQRFRFVFLSIRRY